VTLTGRRIIERFVRKHRDARGWLAEWIRNVEAARWKDIDDVRKLYPAADGGVRIRRGKVVTVFNVKGNEYRLVADILYAAQFVNVLDLMTHAEYSKDLWKDRSYP
jgi:mRNA interferase HigB